MYSEEYRKVIRRPNVTTDIPPRAYVKLILDKIDGIERHWETGLRLGLQPDEVILHDEIYGFVPDDFDEDVMKAAHALYEFMDAELQSRLIQLDSNFESLMWNEMSESVRQGVEAFESRFIDKVRQVRAQYLAEGWVNDRSLEFAYLLAHAQHCGLGYWNMEDVRDDK